MIEDHTQVHLSHDRSFTARFERALVKFLSDFMENETGKEPGFFTERRRLDDLGHSVFVEVRTELPDDPGITLTATIIE